VTLAEELFPSDGAGRWSDPRPALLSIKAGRNLNRILHALAAHIGQIGLGSTERYPLLTPERFRKDLDKLSPSQGERKWGQNKDLMQFGSLKQLDGKSG